LRAAGEKAAHGHPRSIQRFRIDTVACDPEGRFDKNWLQGYSDSALS